MLFHVSFAHCSFLSPAEALGAGLFSSCFSPVSLVASESADQKSLIPIYTTSFTWSWVCVSQCFPVGLPFTTQETSWALCHLTAGGSFFHWPEKQSIPFYLTPLSQGRREKPCLCLAQFPKINLPTACKKEVDAAFILLF